VKFLIGIYQDKKQIDNHFDSLDIKSREIMEVGPFFSRGQALQWMEYMEERLQPCTTERHSVGYLCPNIWYGATFEVE